MSSSDWPELRLGDLGRIVTGRTPPGAQPEHFGGDTPFITPTDMTGSRQVDKPFRCLSSAGAELLRPVLVPRGVAVSCIGWQMGKSLLITRPSATNQQINTIVPDESLVDIEFLYYALSAKRREMFALGAGGSRTPILNKSGFANVRLRLPPLLEQHRIASILGALDDKIELNRRVSRTLELIARAIFKSWFIDFDPVRQKMYGGDTGLPLALAALFPDSLRESSLGVMPEGWVIGTIEDLFVLQRGFDLPKELRTSGPYPVLTASGPAGSHSSSAARGPGVVTGRSGRLGGVWLVESDFWPLNTVLWVKEFRAAGPLWTYQFLQLADLERFNSGSAVPTLNRNHVHLQPALVPPARVVSAFERLTGPLFARRRVSLDESVRLSGIRDAVVPRLLSGGRIDQQPVRHSDEW